MVIFASRLANSLGGGRGNGSSVSVEAAVKLIGSQVSVSVQRERLMYFGRSGMNVLLGKHEDATHHDHETLE